MRGSRRTANTPFEAAAEKVYEVEAIEAKRRKGGSTEYYVGHEEMLPCLSRMARQFLGVPASSAAVERLFSGVGQDFAKQRQAMSEGTLKSHIWARSYVKKKHKDE